MLAPRSWRHWRPWYQYSISIPYPESSSLVKSKVTQEILQAIQFGFNLVSSQVIWAKWHLCWVGSGPFHASFVAHLQYVQHQHQNSSLHFSSFAFYCSTYLALSYIQTYFGSGPLLPPSSPLQLTLLVYSSNCPPSPNFSHIHLLLCFYGNLITLPLIVNQLLI